MLNQRIYKKIQRAMPRIFESMMILAVFWAFIFNYAASTFNSTPANLIFNGEFILVSTIILLIIVIIYGYSMMFFRHNISNLNMFNFWIYFAPYKITINYDLNEITKPIDDTVSNHDSWCEQNCNSLHFIGKCGYENVFHAFFLSKKDLVNYSINFKDMYEIKTYRRLKI